MIKKIIIILSIFYFSSIHAQYDEWTPAKVILKNGISFRGLVKFPKHSGGIISIGSTEFKYKKKKKSKTQKYGHETVEEVIFGDEEFTTLHYKYIPIKPKKYVLLEQIINGKTSLFSRTVMKFQRTIVGYPNNQSNGYYYDDTQYYLIRKGEGSAKLIAGPNSFGTFISKAKKYFSDCEKILYYLENELYDLNNLIELVEDYNLLCE
ncbi:hypothetical protein [Flavisericum labens]|uniref:hypothetical protein n=1 Tax=Flavisericum labens TaxID=3377112 RepID=UPI00387B9649